MPGIFDKEEDNLFTTYEAEIVFRDKIMGGVPKNPKIIEGWLRARAGITSAEEIRQATIRTLQDLGQEVTPDMTFEQLEKASESVAANRQTNGFKVDERGPYVESRAIKAALKEATNILYAGDRWGKTKKGPKSFLAERVFVDPDHINLADEITGVELFIGHVDGPRGPQSNLTYYEYVQNGRLVFTVRSAEDAIQDDWWPRIWVMAQELGLGALRSQGAGRFDLVFWRKIEKKKAKGEAKRVSAKANGAESS